MDSATLIVERSRALVDSDNSAAMFKAIARMGDYLYETRLALKAGCSLDDSHLDEMDEMLDAAAEDVLLISK